MNKHSRIVIVGGGIMGVEKPSEVPAPPRTGARSNLKPSTPIF